ncbi:carbonic anhydrase-related protein 10 isoform 1-T3 [Geothlypis trichas]
MLTTSSVNEPYRLRLTESFQLKDTDWHFVSVNPEQKGTWHQIRCKYIIVGDTKHTPQEIEIAPGMTTSDPEQFVLGLHCIHPPLFLPKGQIVAQAIPVPFLPESTEKQGPTVARVQAIGTHKPKLWCNVSGSGESKRIEMLVDTGADCTVIPVQDWPAHWPLQDIAGHVQGVGGIQLARQSKSIVQIEGPNGQMANIRPFVSDYLEPLLGRDLMAQWGVTTNIPDSPQQFCTAAIEQQRLTQKLKWKTDKPVQVKRWPLSKQKIKALEGLVEEQLKKGHIVETMSPWNSPVFVIQKADKKRWRLLYDLRQINNVIEDMGSPQPGMPSPTMLPQDWKLAVIDIKDCFFHIPLHPDDAPRFAFLVPTINMQAPMKRYHWTVLPQGLKVSPAICQWYVSSLLSPVRAAAEKAIIYHYMDDILMCAPNDDLLTHVLDLTISALIVAGFELQEKKIHKMPPWKYLGLEIGNRTIVPQKLEINPRIKTLVDVHKLCGSLNWVRPWLGLTNEDLAPLFNLLKGGEDPGAPRSITPEARKALEKVQIAMSTRQAHRCRPDLPFKFIILGKLPHLHGIIFQWEEKHTPKAKGTPKKGQDKRDPLLIIEWVFLSHKRSKRMTKPQELVAELIQKARTQIRELAGCDFECIHIPIELKSGQNSMQILEQLLRENQVLQFALYSYSGQISVHRPALKMFEQEVQFTLKLRSSLSRRPLKKALTVFTDASGRSHKSVMTWKDPQTQQWETDIAEVEGSPQVAELAAVVRAFERFSEPFNLITDSAYVAGVVSRADQATLQEVSNITLFELLSKLVKLVTRWEQPFYVMHVRSHTNLPGFIAEGNRRADALAAPAVMATLLNVFEQAKISHQLFHQNAPGLVRQFHITREQAKAIVDTCPNCQQHALPTVSTGANPRGLNSCELWQTDVTHIQSFGRQKYVHVSVDTFSGAVYASAHTGESSNDAIKHLLQAFSFMGIPKELKTDNGPAYKSKEFGSFLQQWGVELKTGIAYSPTGQAIVERTHCNIKRVLDQQQQVLKVEPLHIRLSRALFTINFLNCSFDSLNAPILRHFGGNSHMKLKEKPPVLVKDPETWKTVGPYKLVTWGRGYACVSTPSGLKWVPSKWVRPYVPKVSEKSTEVPQVANAAWRRKRHTCSLEEIPLKPPIWNNL